MLRVSFVASRKTFFMTQKLNETGMFEAYNLKFGNIFVLLNTSSWTYPFTKKNTGNKAMPDIFLQLLSSLF